MTSTRTRRPVLRSAVLALAFSGAALGGFATTASAAVPPSNGTITTAPPVIKPGPKVTQPPVIAIPTPCTHGCNPGQPGNSGDKPVADKPRGDKPGDTGDKPVADKPRADKPGNTGVPTDNNPKLAPKPAPKTPNAPEVEGSSVDAPVVAAATFTG